MPPVFEELDYCPTPMGALQLRRRRIPAAGGDIYEDKLGEVIPKLEIELTSTYGGARATYLKYELKNVMVTSFQTNASGNDEAGKPTVVIANNFEEIKVIYTEFDDTGAARGNVETEYEVERGR